MNIKKTTYFFRLSGSGLDGSLDGLLSVFNGSSLVLPILTSVPSQDQIQLLLRILSVTPVVSTSAILGVLATRPIGEQLETQIPSASTTVAIKLTTTARTVVSRTIASRTIVSILRTIRGGIGELKYLWLRRLRVLRWSFWAGLAGAGASTLGAGVRTSSSSSRGAKRLTIYKKKNVDKQKERWRGKKRPHQEDGPVENWSDRNILLI